MSTEWKPEVGKLVAVSAGYNDYNIKRVVRETKTQWILEGDLRYRKDDLRQVGFKGTFQITPHLSDPESPAVQDYLKVQHRKRFFNKIENELNSLRNCPEPAKSNNLLNTVQDYIAWEAECAS